MSPAQEESRDPLAVVLLGHVDHGKSTIAGRLMLAGGRVPEDKVRRAEAASREHGRDFEPAFLLDGLREERELGVTIDITEFDLSLGGRDYRLIDAPGHREFVRNAFSGSSRASAALIVLDAREGVAEQSRLHGRFAALLGIRSVMVAFNKMDLVGFSEGAFAKLRDETSAFLEGLGLRPVACIPSCAIVGDMVMERGGRLPWYRGPTLVEGLDLLRSGGDGRSAFLRLPVQDVYRFDERRIIVGRIEEGTLRVGDSLRVWPSGRVVTVSGFEAWKEPDLIQEAGRKQSVAITLAEAAYVQRGDLLTDERSGPLLSRLIRCDVLGLSERPLVKGERLRVQIGTAESDAVVESVSRAALGAAETAEVAPPDQVRTAEIAELVVRAAQQMAFDRFSDCSGTGRLVLFDDADIRAGGVITGADNALPSGSRREPAVSRFLHPDAYAVRPEERERRSGHKPLAVWLTGLPGSGKSSIARGLERALFDRGAWVVRLDGDKLRDGLCAGLGFTHADRWENLRRAAEVARLLLDQGAIVIASFISPYRRDRAWIREKLGSERFLEVWVHCPQEICEQRNPNYARARKGEISDFTGVDSPYEAPSAPDLILDSERFKPDECVLSLVRELEARA